MAAVVAEQAVVADFDEARGQEVEAEAAEELNPSQGHGFDVVGIGVILTGEDEGAGLRIEGAQASIGDGDAVGVASQIHCIIRDTATKPNVPVTKHAVPKPVSQSSRRSGAGVRAPYTEPSLAGYTTGSRETTQSTPKGRSPRGKPWRVRSFLRTSCNKRS